MGSRQQNGEASSVPTKPPKSPLRSASVAVRATHEIAAESTNSSMTASTSAKTMTDGDTSQRRGETSTSEATTTTEVTTPPPSSAFLSIGSSGSGRRRAPSDASTGMRATSTWFAGSVTDDDGEDGSVPSSPTGSDWPIESASLFERAKEALSVAETVASTSSPAAAVAAAAVTSHSIEQRQQHPVKRSFSTSKKRAATLPSDAPENMFVRSPSDKLTRTSSKASSGGGILGRLRRISRREKRAVTLDEANVIPESVDAAHTSQSNDEYQPPSFASTARRQSRQADLPIQNASTERTPIFAQERVQSIHSVQPSLVDDESILGRDSPPLVEEDEEGVETWEEPDMLPVTPIDSVDVKATRDEEEEDWHLQNVPGSFFSTASPMAAKKGTETTLKQTPDEEQTISSSSPIAPPSQEVTPVINVSAPTFPSQHERDQPTQYSEALSRQPSYDGGRLASDSGTSAFDEDEATTPRAVADPSRSSYFDAPSSASATVDSPVVRDNENDDKHDVSATPLLQTWLDKAKLAQEERHYLVRFLVTEQLVWELERLFLVKRLEDLETPSSRSKLPSSDSAYLKALPGSFVPDLPIMRLLVRQVFTTCPIFSAATPIEGAAAERTRLTNAIRFFDMGVLPLARFLHTHAIPRPVDVNGEWPSELFDAPSSLDLLSTSLLKSVVRFVTSLVDERGHGFLWSKVPSPTSYDYLSHRTTLNMLKQGGMEVNVVGSRFQAATKECEFILAVRRFGFPPAYVIRSESDFYDYARTLALELGPQVRVRPVPAPDSSEGLMLPFLVDDADARSFDSSPSQSVTSVAERPSMAKSSQMGRTGTSSPVDLESLSNFAGRNKSSVSLSSVKTTNRRRSVDVPKSPLSPVGSVRERSTTTSTKMFATRSSSGFSGFGVGRATSTSDLASLALSAAPLTTDEEARRKQVRAWLRDTLSIRGAGHAQQTRAFLQNDAFVDRELRPGTRKDIVSRLEVDEAAKKERDRSIGEAPREVMELRSEMRQVWRECVEGDGLLRMLKSVQQHDTFSALPLTYQRIVSWANLQIAKLLHHALLDSHEARRNFDRFQELVAAVPWRLLSMAIRERTGLMMQKVQASFQDNVVRKKLFALFLQDAPPEKIEAELVGFKKRLGGTVMRKLEVYVQSSAGQKAVVRRAARQADIPLVAAIMRGSDRPLLAAEGIKKVVGATRAYKEFVASQPTYVERKAKLKANVEVRLISDMQRALCLLSYKRGGKAVREGMEAELEPAVDALLEPLLDLLRRLHRNRSAFLRRRPSVASVGTKTSRSATELGGGSDIVLDVHQFCLKLLDVLAGLRARVQDPWRSLSTLTLLMDDAVPAWYQLLHAFSLDDSLLHDFVVWLQTIVNLLPFRGGEGGGAGEDLLARFWPKPEGKRADPFEAGRPERVVLESIVEDAWRKRTRQLETACRWAAGDADADMDIQLFGEGGKTRTTPYELPKAKAGPTQKEQSVLLKLLPGFRDALDRVLGADPGTAW